MNDAKLLIAGKVVQARSAATFERGVKSSGYGRFGGKAGVDAFTELRWITLQTTPRHYPF